MALNARQLMTMMGGFKQQKKSLNPFIDFQPMIYKKFMMMNQGDTDTTSPIVDKANLGYPGLQEEVRALLESEGRYTPKEISYLVDYLLRNGLVSSNEYTLAKRILQDPLAASRLESLRGVLVKMFNKFMDFCLKDPQNYVRSRLMLVSSQARKHKLKESLVESVYEAVLHRKTAKKLNMDDPNYRQIGTDSLTQIYRKMTPGMEIEENRHWRSGRLIVRRDSYKNRYRGKLARRYNRDNEEEEREKQMVKRDSENLKESDETMKQIKALWDRVRKREKEKMAIGKSQKYIDYPHDNPGHNKIDFSKLLKKESLELIEAAYSKSSVDKAIKSSRKKIGGKEAKKIHALLKGRQKEDEPKKDVKEDTLQEGRHVASWKDGKQYYTSKGGDKIAKVYKDTDTGEHIVKMYINGKRHEAADYFTDDKDDAHGTAKFMVKGVKEEVQPSPSGSAFGQKPKKSMRAGEGKVQTNGADTNVNKSNLAGKKTTKVKGMPKGISEDQVAVLANLCGNLERERNKYSD